jgi:hypothetical protein
MRTFEGAMKLSDLEVIKGIKIYDSDRVCDLVARVPGYRSRGLGFDSRCYHIFLGVVSLERGPLSLVSTTEDILGRKCSGSGLESREYGLGIRHADHAVPSMCKSWH